VQHLAAGAGHPLHGLRGLQATAPAQGVAVEPQGRGGIAFLRLHAEGPNQASWGRWAVPDPNPNDGPTAVQGSGTRQPSRPFSAPRDRLKTGSWTWSPGMSGTSCRPSSSPWYRYAEPGRASISRIAARARRRPRPRSSLGEVVRHRYAVLARVELVDQGVEVRDDLGFGLLEHDSGTRACGGASGYQPGTASGAVPSPIVLIIARRLIAARAGAAPPLVTVRSGPPDRGSLPRRIPAPSARECSNQARSFG
jgi:hypothetical protein